MTRSRRSPECPDGVALVSLAPVRDPALLPGAIARSLGVIEAGGTTSLQRVVAIIGNHRLLLLLDNFEHLASAAPAMASCWSCARG